jgi:hypothetical protein
VGTRVGIELSPVACRLVELEGPDVVPGQPPATRVRSYSVLPPSGLETDRLFATLDRRPVTVIVWGVRSDHRQVVVSKGSYEKMRAEALVVARAAGVDTEGTIADITTASTAIKGASRQPVVIALANAHDVSAALRPLVDAHVRIRSVITPADALLGLARSRQAFVIPGAIEAYVALDATVTCVALVRDGSLLIAREMPWGYEGGFATPAVPHDPEVFARREDLATRLLDDLADFLTTVGAESDAVAQISICGGLPDLRTMTVPLMERLDIEVEALDSLFGIDVDQIPEPAVEFRERAAELRLAWAAAADWRGPINLMRYRRRRNRRVVVARAAVVAGVAAGLGSGWAIQQSQWWQSTAREPMIARRTPPAIVPPTPTAPARENAAPRPQAPAVAASQPPVTSPTAPTAAPPVTRSPSTAPPSPAATASRAPASPPAGTRTPLAVPPVARTPPPISTLAAPLPPAPAARPSTATAPPTSTAPSAPAARPPASTVPPASAARAPTPTAPPASAARPPTSTAPPASVPAPVGIPGAAAALGTAARPASPVVVPPVVQRPAEPPPLPFDAVLGTILYSPGRRFAIVNGRIVGPGDEVNGARILDITQTTVLLRDAQGRLRSLTLGSGGRTPAASQ